MVVYLHIAFVHEVKKPFKRIKCMKEHVSSVHEGKKTFKCEVCNNSCPGKSNLNQLAALVHEGNKPFEYKICNFSYSEKSNLIRTLHPFMKKINYIKNWFMGITRLEILKPP